MLPPPARGVPAPRRQNQEGVPRGARRWCGGVRRARCVQRRRCRACRRKARSMCTPGPLTPTGATLGDCACGTPYRRRRGRVAPSAPTVYSRPPRCSSCLSRRWRRSSDTQRWRSNAHPPTTAKRGGSARSARATARRTPGIRGAAGRARFVVRPRRHRHGPGLCRCSGDSMCRVLS